MPWHYAHEMTTAARVLEIPGQATPPDRDFTQFRSNYLGRHFAWTEIAELNDAEFLVVWAEARTFVQRVKDGLETEGTLSRLYGMLDTLCQLISEQDG